MESVVAIRKVHVIVHDAPLNQIFRIATGRHDHLRNVFLSLELSDGTVGFGEAAVATHVTGETVEVTARNLESAREKMIGEKIADYWKIIQELRVRLKANRAAVAAIEMALLDAVTRAEKIPLWNFFGPRVSPLTTDITIVLGDLAQTQQSVEKFYAQGFRTFKVKVGQDRDLDLKRILLVNEFAPKAKILIDANQSFTAAQALSFLEELARQKIDPIMIEQPVAKNDWEGLKKVTHSTKVPVCADESISSLTDVAKIVRGQYANVINIKLMKFGFFEGREMVLLAKKAGLGLMIGAMMESNLSSMAAIHFAAGLGGFDFVDVDTPFFVKNESEQNPHLSPKGTYDFKKVKAGIGIIPSLK